VEIERQAYDRAIDSFKKAISIDLCNPLHLLWQAYASYLHAEFILGPDNQRYQEQILSIIRGLERAEKLCQGQIKNEIGASILYFLGCFYHKTNDLIHAKERLQKCVKLDSPLKSSARELLENIWNYEVRPPLWRFWLTAPLYTLRKRILYVLIILSISTLILLYPFMGNNLVVGFLGMWFMFVGPPVSAYFYSLVIGIFILILLFPIIRRIKAKDIEVEIHAPPSFEPLFPPAMMAEMMGKLEKWRKEDLSTPAPVE
jgi:tetratricopeptide (TPR) repeat protein